MRRRRVAPSYPSLPFSIAALQRQASWEAVSYLPPLPSPSTFNGFPYTSLRFSPSDGIFHRYEINLSGSAPRQRSSPLRARKGFRVVGCAPTRTNARISSFISPLPPASLLRNGTLFRHCGDASRGSAYNVSVLQGFCPNGRAERGAFMSLMLVNGS